MWYLTYAVCVPNLLMPYVQITWFGYCIFVLYVSVNSLYMVPDNLQSIPTL